MNAEGANTTLLEGVRVLDFADESAGFCAKLMADMGAQVIKVEKPGGDRSRMTGPFWHDVVHPERSLSFWYNNTNKQGITLDIESRAGREIIKKLIRRTDVLVETFAPGRLEVLDLGYDALSEENPQIILASVTGFGQNGPRGSYKSCDLVASAYGGQMHVTGNPDSAPLKAFGGQPYYAASLFAAFGILLALRKRRKNGYGEHLDISLQEAVASTLDHVLVRYFYENDIARRRGSLHWNNAFFIFPCKDGFIHLSLFHQWETLVEWMEQEGMAGDLKEEKWKEENYRHRHLDHIVEVIGKWTGRHIFGELFEMGQLMGFPWAPVLSPGEVAQSPQLAAREFFVEIDHPELGTTLKYPGSPYRSGSSPSIPQKRAPLIGEDNLRVYGDELGYTEEELARLSAAGTI